MPRLQQSATHFWEDRSQEDAHPSVHTAQNTADLGKMTRAAGEEKISAGLLFTLVCLPRKGLALRVGRKSSGVNHHNHSETTRPHRSNMADDLAAQIVAAARTGDS